MDGTWERVPPMILRHTKHKDDTPFMTTVKFIELMGKSGAWQFG